MMWNDFWNDVEGIEAGEHPWWGIVYLAVHWGIVFGMLTMLFVA